MRRLIIAAAMLQLGIGGAAFAADPRNPDWPCVQAKVPELAVAAVWSGPPIDDVGTAWRDDPGIADVVARIAARRTPLDEAERLAAGFVQEAADKAEAAQLLFAGLFATLNRERLEVINGLERLTRRQRDFAESIEADAARLRGLHEQSQVEPAMVEELTTRIEWETRIFEERRKSIRYVCEVPVTIERRFFALARAIQQQLP